MSKYIDTDKFRAEIDRRIKEYNAIIESQPDSNRAERDAWKWAECKSLLSFLDTLQEPEADLEKEIEKAHQRFPEVSFAKLARIAKRFYELGKNAK